MIEAAVRSPADASAGPAVERLRAMRARAVAHLVDRLAREPRASRRRRLCEVLADVVAGRPDLLGAYLHTPSWYLARNLAFVLGETRDPAGITHLAALGRHPEYRVRREVIDALGKIGTEAARGALMWFFADPDPRIRHHLIAGLDTYDPRASAWLVGIVRSRDYSRQGTSLKAAAIAALGRMGADEALPLLKRVAHTRWAFGRKRKLLQEIARGVLQDAYSSR